MREKRMIKAQVVSEYNDVAKCINEQELAIYVVGDAYKDIKKKVKSEKNGSKIQKGGGSFLIGFGGLSIAVGAGIGAIPLALMFALGVGECAMAGRWGDFKNYKMKDNKKAGRLELLRVKGKGIPVDLRYDTIIE